MPGNTKVVIWPRSGHSHDVIRAPAPAPGLAGAGAGSQVASTHVRDLNTTKAVIWP